jgi:ribosomal protein L18
MAIAGCGYTINGAGCNPGTLNTWLKGHGGYDGSNDMYYAAPQGINSNIKFLSMHLSNDIPYATIVDYLKKGTVVIADVHNGTHFVLCTGFGSDGDTIAVNDPGYATTSYSYKSGIVGWRIYSMRTSSIPTAPSALTMTIPFNYPRFSQGDPKWASDIMNTKTIQQVGCLMSSTAMAIAGVGYTINGAACNPGTLNTWLKGHGGYDGSNDMYYAAPHGINSKINFLSMHTSNDIPYATIVDYLKKGTVVIANVHNGAHFVLCTGFGSDGDTIAVNDPGYSTTSYSYKSGICGWRLFSMR